MHDLRDAVSFHQLILAANNAALRTQQQYLLYECAFLEYLQHKRLPPRLEELNLGRVSEFLVWYRNRPHPRRTRGGEVAVRAAADVLKRLGGVLEQNEYFETNPLRKLGRPRVTKYVRTPFSAQEINAMWGACFRTEYPARDEALFLLLLDTGMRIGEAAGLRLDHVDLKGRQVTVLGKGRRERVIPVGSEDRRDGGRTVRALTRYLTMRTDVRPEAEPFVFTARGGRKMTPATAADIIRRIAGLGDVENAYPHRLRHTFATWYLTVYPGDELGLRRIIGHISSDVLADYIHFADTTIAQRAGRVSLAESWLGNSPNGPLTQARLSAVVKGGAGPPGRGKSERPSRAQS
jgi:site-specific recombinase XerD